MGAGAAAWQNTLGTNALGNTFACVLCAARRCDGEIGSHLGGTENTYEPKWKCTRTCAYIIIGAPLCFVVWVF